jgi:RNA polymerase sigma-70 factor (ECF subfamily)
LDDNISNQLIEKCKNGDRRSLKELYLYTVDNFRTIAWRYCPDNEDAMDIVHNAYLMIFKHIKKFDNTKGNFYSWGSKIIINEALQFLRKKNKIISNDFWSNLYLENTEINLEIYTLQEVKILVHQLELAQRVIFNMHFFDELTYREIASILNIKESSARANVSRAKKAFLEIWKRFDNSVAL